MIFRDNLVNKMAGVMIVKMGMMMIEVKMKRLDDDDDDDEKDGDGRAAKRDDGYCVSDWRCS